MDSQTTDLILKDIPPQFKNSKIVAFDIETTGLNAELDSLIEFGAIEIKNGLIKEYSYLFSDGRSSPYLTRCVHGIKDKDRKSLPSLKDKVQELSLLLSNALLVGHNIKNFDIPFIQYHFNKHLNSFVDYKVYDTLVLAKQNLKNNDNRLESLCNQYKLSYGAHRGLGDSISAMLLFNLIHKNLVLK